MQVVSAKGAGSSSTYAHRCSVARFSLSAGCVYVYRGDTLVVDDCVSRSSEILCVQRFLKSWGLTDFLFDCRAMMDDFVQ